jgi:hypothetical protein
MQPLRRVAIVLGLLSLAAGIIIAFLPVSISGTGLASGISVGCNPQSISNAYNTETNASAQDRAAGGSSYEPAVGVWITPSSAVPAGMVISDARAASALCGSAASSQMIPSVALFGVGVFLLLFGGVIIRYIGTGRL